MASEKCSTVFGDLSDKLALHSPEPNKDLTTSEHNVAEKLAADVRQAMSPPADDGSKWWDVHTRAFADANKVVDGVDDKSRLNGILADANTLLSKDDEKLLQTNQGVILGKQNPENKIWSVTPLKPINCDLEQFNVLPTFLPLVQHKQ
jgi:hypothetical protein